MSHLEEIKLKISIEELVSGYLPLKKAGRNLKGLCPFHNDTKPSFMVSPEKGIAYCFACNTGGDIFKFIQLIEKVDFPQAVRILAERTNVKLPSYNPQKQDARAKTLKLNQLTTRFYQDQLKNHPEHQQYFLGRGLKPETIEHFQLGYSPDSYQALKNHLIEQGYEESDLIAAGLTNQRSIADKTSYDRFRNRLMFPLFNAQGQPVGFAGRIIEQGEPKYLNSPDTPAYQKSFVVYGLNWAKEAIKKEDLVIVVEGYMDVIATHQWGTKNTVATSGTALTPQQLKLLKRYTQNIAFAFDADAAGMQATQRGIELAQQAGFNITILQIPNGKDPDECIQKNPQDWEKAIEKRVPAMDFYLNHAFSQYNKNDLEGKKAIAQILLPLIKKMPTAMEQNHYLEKLALELKTDVKWLWHDMKKMKPQTSYSQKEKEPKEQAEKKADFSRETFLIGFLVQHPHTYPLLHEHLIDSMGLNKELEKFYKLYKNVYNRQGSVSLKAVKTELSPQEAEKLDIYGLLVEENYPDFSNEAALKEVRGLIKEINQKNLRALQKDYILKLKSTKNQDEKRGLLEKYHQLLTLKNNL